MGSEGGDQGERLPSKEIRNKLIEINLSVWTFWGAWSAEEDGGVKQYLPDSPAIPLITYDAQNARNLGVRKGHSDLIAVQALRSDSLVVPREQNYDPDKFPPDSDFINIPSSFIKKDSYIALLVPIYGLFPEKGIIGWDTTILKCISDQQLVKLQGGKEAGFKEAWNRREDKGKLPAPKYLNDGHYETTTINVDGKKGVDSVNIWMGNLFDNNYKGVVNGAICYRMVEGKAEKKKSKDPERLLKLVPQKVGAI